MPARHPTDDLVERYGSHDVIRALDPLLSDERRARIEAVLDARLGSLTVVLENLHDPHNGAAAIRSVEAFGLAGLHVVEAAEPFRFSTSVTIGCDKWIALHRHPDVGSAAAALRGRGFRLYATLPDAVDDLETVDVSQPCALWFGNEHEGLGAEAVAACDGAVAIPMYGFTRSFNLSVSVAIAVQRLAARRRVALGASGDLDPEERARLRARWYALGVRGAPGIVERFVSNRTRKNVDTVTRSGENH